jgi:hypothetical protein
MSTLAISIINERKREPITQHMLRSKNDVGDALTVILQSHLMVSL